MDRVVLIDVCERRTNWNRSLAAPVVPIRLGGTAAVDHCAPDLQRKRDHLFSDCRWGWDVLVARGDSGTSLRGMLGDVELQKPGALGVCHSFRASVQTV